MKSRIRRRRAAVDILAQKTEKGGNTLCTERFSRVWLGCADGGCVLLMAKKVGRHDLERREMDNVRRREMGAG